MEKSIEPATPQKDADTPAAQTPQQNNTPRAATAVAVVTPSPAPKTPMQHQKQTRKEGARRVEASPQNTMEHAEMDEARARAEMLYRESAAIRMMEQTERAGRAAIRATELAELAENLERQERARERRDRKKEDDDEARASAKQATDARSAAEAEKRQVEREERRCDELREELKRERADRQAASVSDHLDRARERREMRAQTERLLEVAEEDRATIKHAQEARLEMVRREWSAARAAERSRTATFEDDARKSVMHDENKGFVDVLSAFAAAASRTRGRSASAKPTPRPGDGGARGAAGQTQAATPPPNKRTARTGPPPPQAPRRHHRPEASEAAADEEADQTTQQDTAHGRPAPKTATKRAQAPSQVLAKVPPRPSVRVQPPAAPDRPVVDPAPTNATQTDRKHYSFDGGYAVDKNACVGAAYVSHDRFITRSVEGPGSSYAAEITGALLAHELALDDIKTDKTIKRVLITGDHYHVLFALGTRTTDLYAKAGRSPVPNMWLKLSKLQDELEKTLGGPSAVEYTWMPRRYNAYADELCRALIDGRPPAFPASVPVVPTHFTPPDVETIEKCFRRCEANGRADTIRSLPAFLRQLWHQTLSHVASWEHGARALVVAPKVLLRQNKTVDLRARLARFAKEPQAVEHAFYVFAHEIDEELRTEAPPGVRTEADKMAMVERVAAQAPARALKLLLSDAPPADPNSIEAREALKKLAGETSTQFRPPADVQKPKFVQIETIMTYAGKGLSRLASPGADGWTRELFLASMCRGTTSAFEQIVNALMQGETLGPADPSRAARCCMWKKPDSDKFRIIGMTSMLAKLAWKIVIAKHCAQHGTSGNYALGNGGCHAVLRWLDDSTTQCAADVIDAYWAVNRTRTAATLEEMKSPAAWMFWRTYSAAPTMILGTRTFPLHNGVLPGCSGAALAFALDVEAFMKNAPDLTNKCRFYMDDANFKDVESFKKFVAYYGRDKLSKLKVVGDHCDAAIAADDSITKSVATKQLGGFLGEERAAAALLIEHLAKKKVVLDRIGDAKVSKQTKFALIGTVEKSLVWTMSATRPEVTAHAKHLADEMLANSVLRLIPPELAEPTNTSRVLISSPLDAGGLGFTNFQADSAELHAIAKSNIVPSTSENPHATPQQLKKLLTSRGDTRIRTVLSGKQAEARKDPSTSWVQVQAITKQTTISDEGFELGLINMLDANVTYATCDRFNPAKESMYNHSHGCLRCAAPYWWPRHQRILQVFISVCTQYGVVASANLYPFGGSRGSCGRDNKQPDVIVYRGLTSERPLMLDVTVAHMAPSHDTNTIARGTQRKIYKYKKWADDLGADFAPLVFSTRAQIPSTTYDVIKAIDKQTTKKGFVRDVVRRIKVAMIEFEVTRRKALDVRKRIGRINDEPSTADKQAQREDAPDDAHASAAATQPTPPAARADNNVNGNGDDADDVPTTT